MLRLETVVASSHLDKHNDQISLDALKDLVEQINGGYLPMGVEHDPRIPPVGRLVSARLEHLADGEYQVLGMAEIFQPNDTAQLSDDKKRMNIAVVSAEQPVVEYDLSYDQPEDITIIDEIAALIGAKTEWQIKKALEPLSVLSLAVNYFAAGFLGKMGEDAWDALKNRLLALFARKRAENRDYLMILKITYQEEDRYLEVQTIVTNPSECDLAFLRKRSSQIDKIALQVLRDHPYIARLVLECGHGEIEVKYCLSETAVPVEFVFQSNPGDS